MAKFHTLQIGRSKVKLSRSDTQIAVRPQVGMAQSMENALRSATRDVSVERSGRLGGFELVQIQASPAKVSRARSSLRTAASVDREVPVYHTSKDNVPFVPVGTIYLSFKPEQAETVKQAVLDKHRLELVASERNGFLTVRVTQPGTDAVEVAAKLQREKSIAVAEPDLVTTKRLRSFSRPDDELLSHEWHLENTGMHGGETLGFKPGADARVIAAWKLLDGLGSDEVVVGVIDDGFDLSHPDLANKAVAPWDFERESADVHPEPDLNSPIAGNWHGTACAAVAVGNAGGGHIVGAAPAAKLMPLRMNQSLSPTLVARWFDHMTGEGAWVVSCSWGAEAEVYPLPDRIAHAIARCATQGRNGKGCVVLFAAGNSKSDISDPPRSQNGFATHPDVMAISACSSRDEFSDYSNFGKEVWACAPSSGLGAWDVTTADVTGTYLDASGRERSSGYAAGDYNPHFVGTSSACPLAAGVCALILSANPELTSVEVREIIKRTARKIGPASDYRNGHSVKFGFGCVDAEAAVREALRLAPPVRTARVARESVSATAARAGARGLVPAATRPRGRSALPNLFEFVIEEALAEPSATVESVATAIARSSPFLTAVQLGMAHVPPANGIPSQAQMTRIKLAKAFSAPTGGTMFT
ncbi:MAG: S8 family serine peptidase [Xanthobacteraceae bacterium]